MLHLIEEYGLVIDCKHVMAIQVDMILPNGIVTILAAADQVALTVMNMFQ